MRKNKILMPIMAVASIVPAASMSTACHEKSQVEEVIEAIKHPTTITTPVHVDSFYESLKALDEGDRQKEVIYDLFSSFNQAKSGEFEFEKSIIQMYDEGIVSAKANITKCSLSIVDKDNITSTFLGYVSFVFNQEIKGKITAEEETEVTFKSGDYIMLTFDFFNAKVTLNEENCSLEYEPKMGMIGITKFKYNDGNDEAMFEWEVCDTSFYSPKNSHNWTTK